MALTGQEIKTTYPLPVYNYRVTILDGGNAQVIGFSEISGLSVEYEPVSYVHGLSFALGGKIIPGKRQAIRVTMKRGIVKSNDFLQGWLSKTYTDPFYDKAKRDILIDLCDEAGKAVVRWTVKKALPLKLEVSAFDANSNEVAIETMELAAHGLTVDYQPPS